MLPLSLILSSAIAASTEADADPAEDAEAPRTVEAPAFVDLSTLPAAHVVFEDIPKQRRRRKLIRYAMRKDPNLVGGSDWGRVLCFRFESERSVAVLEAAADKARLQAQVRPAPNCQVPPPEAFLPPEPDHSVFVTFDSTHTIPAIRPELTTLLDHDERLSSIRVRDDAPGRLCLEYQKVPDAQDVQDLLGRLSFPIDTTEVVDDCEPAMARPEPE